MMKKLIVFMAVLCLLWGCTKKPEHTQPDSENSNKTVGISLPDFEWNEHATQLTQQLEAAGYQVLVEYASGDAQLQHSQVQTLVNMPVSCLVVVAIDSMSLCDVLAEARQENLPVIALDRMLMYTDGVTGCVAIDAYTAGQQLGQHIIKEKQLSTAETPVTIEFFMDTSENHNALLFHQGIMEQLQSYLNSGVLQCLSGRTAFEDVCIQLSTADTASERCFDYLAEFYEEKAPDVLCAATDTLAAGCIGALTSFGLEPGEDWPLITGMGATEVGIDNILQGYQSVSLYTDTEALVTQCAQWVQAAMAETSLSDDTIFNGVAEVPAILLIPTPVDAENYKDVLP